MVKKQTEKVNRLTEECLSQGLVRKELGRKLNSKTEWRKRSGSGEQVQNTRK